MKSQFEIKNSPNLISILEAAPTIYVDNKFKDPSIVRNSAHIDFSNRNLDNVCLMNF